MKKLLAVAALVALSSTHAFAADIQPRMYSKAPMVDAAWSWTGLYAGVNVGYGVGSADYVNNLNFTGSGVLFAGNSGRLGTNGAIGGGQIGYNFQVSPMTLVGVEADFQGADIKGANRQDLSFFSGAGTYASLESRLKSFGTVRGRLGWITTPSTVLYVTGGLAYGQTEINLDINNGAGETLKNSSDKIRAGYALGGGIETRLGSNWTAKAEYLYVDLGERSSAVRVPPVGTRTSRTSVKFKDEVVRVGLNYKFD